MQENFDILSIYNSEIICANNLPLLCLMMASKGLTLRRGSQYVVVKPINSKIGKYCLKQISGLYELVVVLAIHHW